jgi:hypothetical protein
MFGSLRRRQVGVVDIGHRLPLAVRLLLPYGHILSAARDRLALRVFGDDLGGSYGIAEVARACNLYVVARQLMVIPGAERAREQ